MNLLLSFVGSLDRRQSFKFVVHEITTKHKFIRDNSGNCPKFMTQIIDLFLERVYFPNSWKQIIVNPLSKTKNHTEYSDL